MRQFLTSPAFIAALALAAVCAAFALPFAVDRATGGLVLYGGGFFAVLGIAIVGVKITRVARAYYDRHAGDPDGDGYPDNGLTEADAIALAGLYRFAGLVAVAVAVYLGGVPTG